MPDLSRVTSMIELRSVWPIYTPTRIEKLAGLGYQALDRIETRIEVRSITLPGGERAWGQYLDDKHYSPDQWGLLGTCAAIQAISVRARAGRTAQQNHLITDGLRMLPEDVNDPPAVLQEKVGPPKQDLESIFRLAFIAASLRPGDDLVPPVNRPPLVQTILDLADNGERWEPQSALPGRVVRAGDLFMTAWVLVCLQRYEHEPGREFEPHRRWLANQVLDGADIGGRIHYACLAGLALVPVGGRPEQLNPAESARIEEARKAIEHQIRDWRSRRGRVVEVNRPVFEGFNLGHATDYTFLNPELLGSLYLLRRGNPKPARHLVLRTIEAVHTRTAEQRAFEGQVGMEATVDQVWAAQLLYQFREVQNDPLRRKTLRPPLVPTRRFTAFVMLLVAIVIGAVIGLISDSAEAGIVAGALLALVQFISNPPTD